MTSAPFLILRRTRRVARRARDHRLLSAVLLAPFQLARRAGVRLPHRVYQHLPFRGAFDVSCGDARNFSMRSYGHHLENGLYWRGLQGWEPETLAVWLCAARTANVVLDIGANTGLFSLVAACVARHVDVHAFEPVTRIAHILRENVGMNPTLSVTVHEAAVGAANGTLDLYDPGGDVCYSASLEASFLPGVVKQSYPVAVLAIDEFANAQNLRGVDLIKLDVEGAEEAALAGMRRTIDRFRPLIVMEALKEARERAEVSRLLKSGYAAFRLTSGGPVRSASVWGGAESRNVLLASNERQAEVERICRELRSS